MSPGGQRCQVLNFVPVQLSGPAVVFGVGGAGGTAMLVEKRVLYIITP